MSFIYSEQKKSQVFDITTGRIVVTGFANRRLLTIAGKPLLGEKNLPVKPSQKQLFKKCYESDETYLYRYKRYIDPCIAQHLDSKLKHEKQDFSAPLKVYLPSARIRIPGTYQLTCVPGLDKICKDKSELEGLSFTFDIFGQRFNHKSEINPVKSYDFFELEEDFSFKDKQQKLIGEILGKEFSEINIYSERKLRFDHKFVNLISYEATEDLSYLLFSDLTKFTSAHRDKMLLTGLNPRLPVSEPQRLIVGWQKYREENCQLIGIKHYPNTISTELIIPKVKHDFVFDLFACFYIKTDRLVYNPRFSFSQTLPAEFNEAVISSSIRHRKQKSFDKRTLNTQIKESYSERKKSVNSLPFPESVQCFEIKDANDSFKYFKKNRTEIQVKCKKHQPHFATGLRLENLSFNISEKIFKNLLQPKKCFKVDERLPRLLKAKVPELRFIHEKPITFDYNFNRDFLLTNALFLFRKTRFFNKCPNHAKYCHRLLKNIEKEILGKTLYKFRFNENSFILSSYEPDVKWISKIQHEFQPFFPTTIPNRTKFENTRINSLKQNFSDIELFNSQCNLKLVLDYSDIDTKVIKPSPAKLRKLRKLLLSMPVKDRAYRQAKLVATKRLLTKRKAINIYKSPTEINTSKDKAWISLKSDTKTYRFKSRIALTFEKIKQRLPKQITDYFSLNIEIPSMIPEKKLKPVPIIPPPAWEKIFLNPLWLTNIEPHPFGFPEYTDKIKKYHLDVVRKNLSLPDKTPKAIRKLAEYISSKSRLYLPALSMKNPRRMLHSKITPQNSPKEFYISYFQETPLKTSQAKNIATFKQRWQIEEDNGFWNLLCNDKYKMFEKTKGKVHCFSIKKAQKENNEFRLLLDIQNSLTMKKTTSFKPRNKNFKLKAQFISLPLYEQITSFVEKLEEHVAIKEKSSYISRIGGCSMQDSRIKALPCYLTVTTTAKDNKPIYETRFRSFHFPYRPEFSTDFNVGHYLASTTIHDDISEKDRKDCKLSDSLSVLEPEPIKDYLCRTNIGELSLASALQTGNSQNFSLLLSLPEKEIIQHFIDFSINDIMDTELSIIPPKYYDCTGSISPADMNKAFSFKQDNIIYKSLLPFDNYKFCLPQTSYEDESHSLTPENLNIERVENWDIDSITSFSVSNELMTYKHLEDIADLVPLESDFSEINIPNEDYAEKFNRPRIRWARNINRMSLCHKKVEFEVNEYLIDDTIASNKSCSLNNLNTIDNDIANKPLSYRKHDKDTPSLSPMASISPTIIGSDLSCLFLNQESPFNRQLSLQEANTDFKLALDINLKLNKNNYKQPYTPDWLDLVEGPKALLRVKS